MPSAHSSIPRPGGLLGSLLPARVSAAESLGETSRASGGLFPAEQAAVRTAGLGRQAGFTAGRLCARAALAALGLPAVAILPGPAGEPQWPAGVTGSITHCAGYQACAAALTADVAAIGIDAEPDQPLPAGLIRAVATGAERAWIAERSAMLPGVSWDRLLFSGKEAACKMWYPLTGQWPALCSVAVFPDTDGTFTVRMQGAGPGVVPRPASKLTGRWVARGGLVVTAIAWLPAIPPAPAETAASTDGERG